MKRTCHLVYYLCQLITVSNALNITISQLQSARGSSVTISCSYSTNSPNFIDVKTNTATLFHYVPSIKNYTLTNSFVGHVQNVNYNDTIKILSLKLVNIDFDHDEQYKCETKSGFTTETSTFVNLTVIGEPESVGIFNSSSSCSKGDSINYTCYANNGRPAPTIEWKKFINSNTVPLPFDNNTETLGDQIIIANSTYTGAYSTRRTLSVTVYELAQGEEITYKCYVSNATSDNLHVVPCHHSPPVVINSQNVSLYEGEPVELACNATGVPVPSVQWLYANGSQICGDSKCNITATIEECYRCNASSTAGRATSLTCVTLLSQTTTEDPTTEILSTTIQSTTVESTSPSTPDNSYVTMENHTSMSSTTNLSVTTQTQNKATDTSTSSTSTTTKAPPAPPPPPGKSGLSQEAIIGISVGCGCGACFLVIAVVVWTKKKKGIPLFWVCCISNVKKEQPDCSGQSPTKLGKIRTFLQKACCCCCCHTYQVNKKNEHSDQVFCGCYSSIGDEEKVVSGVTCYCPHLCPVFNVSGTSQKRVLCAWCTSFIESNEQSSSSQSFRFSRATVHPEECMESEEVNMKTRCTENMGENIAKSPLLHDRKEQKQPNRLNPITPKKKKKRKKSEKNLNALV